MKKTIMTLLALLTMGVASAQKSELPLVYDVEHTGSRFAAPKMPLLLPRCLLSTSYLLSVSCLTP